MDGHTAVQHSREELVGLCSLQRRVWVSGLGRWRWDSARLCPPQGLGLRPGKEWAGRASWRVDVQTIPAPPPLSTAVLIPAFLQDYPGHGDLLYLPCPWHPAMKPPALQLPAWCLQSSGYSPIKRFEAQGWQGAVLGTSQPHGHEEQCLCPGPCPGPGIVCHP